MDLNTLLMEIRFSGTLAPVFTKKYFFRYYKNKTKSLALMEATSPDLEKQGFFSRRFY